MSQLQLMIFEETEEQVLKRELASTKEQLNNLRRGIFGRYDKMATEIFKLQQHIQKLEEHVGMPDKKESKIFELSFM